MAARSEKFAAQLDEVYLHLDRAIEYAKKVPDAKDEKSRDNLLRMAIGKATVARDLWQNYCVIMDKEIDTETKEYHQLSIDDYIRQLDEIILLSNKDPDFIKKLHEFWQVTSMLVRSLSRHLPRPRQ